MRTKDLPLFTALEPKEGEVLHGHVGFRDFINWYKEAEDDENDEKVILEDPNNRLNSNGSMGYNEEIVKLFEEGKANFNHMPALEYAQLPDGYLTVDGHSKTKGAYRGWVAGHYAKEYRENKELPVNVCHAKDARKRHKILNTHKGWTTLMKLRHPENSIHKQLDTFLKSSIGEEKFPLVSKKNETKFQYMLLRLCVAYQNYGKLITYENYIKSELQAKLAIDDEEKLREIKGDIGKAVQFLTNVHEKILQLRSKDQFNYQSLINDVGLAAFLMIDFLGLKRLTHQRVDALAYLIMTQTARIPEHTMKLRRKVKNQAEIVNSLYTLLDFNKLRKTSQDAMYRELNKLNPSLKDKGLRPLSLKDKGLRPELVNKVLSFPIETSAKEVGRQLQLSDYFVQKIRKEYNNPSWRMAAKTVT